MGKQAAKKKSIITYTGKGAKVKIRGKVLAKGNISLYLDYYTGYKINAEEKLVTNRQIEYLNIYLVQNPRDSQERQKNKENLSLAKEIRNQRESDINHNKAGLISPHLKKVNFLDFADQYVENYEKKDVRMMESTIRHFKKYAKVKDLKPHHINSELMQGYASYLKLKFNGETPNSYFSRFKKVLNAGIDKGLFIKNPADGIRCPKPKGLSKDFLEAHEVQQLAKAYCSNAEIKRAFLFSLNTGLRFVDINDLKFKHIKNSQIIKPQQKTGDDVVIDLNDTALKLLGKKGKREEQVFNLPSLTGCLKVLKTWTSTAGIEKNITWHSARHSFATILLTNNSDIKTVSNLLGHSSLDHTQKYTHVVNELKKKAVNQLPEIDF